MATKIIRTNTDHHEIDHRMHLYELIRDSVFAPLRLVVGLGLELLGP